MSHFNCSWQFKDSMYLLLMVSLDASTQNAIEIKSAKISSVDLVDQCIMRDTSNNAYVTKNKLFHNPTQQYTAKKSKSKSSHIVWITERETYSTYNCTYWFHVLYLVRLGFYGITSTRRTVITNWYTSKYHSFFKCNSYLYMQPL